MNHTTGKCGHPVVAVGFPGSDARRECEASLCVDCREDDSRCEHCGKALRECEHTPVTVKHKVYYTCDCRS